MGSVKNVAIILAGGIGSRVGEAIPKQFIEVEGHPILAYTVKLFEDNPNIDAIEIVCHKEWFGFVREMVRNRGFTKVRWIVDGGDTFQKSVLSGVLNLRNYMRKGDNVIISFGVSPLTPQEDIDDCIRICTEHGNAISSKDIDLCLGIKDNEQYTHTPVMRETLKGFANPWGFEYSELLSTYEKAIEKGILSGMEPHTTSLYLYFGKKLWFSQCTSPSVKITTKQDIDVLRGLLLLKKINESNSKC